MISLSSIPPTLIIMDARCPPFSNRTLPSEFSVTIAPVMPTPNGILVESKFRALAFAATAKYLDLSSQA